MAFVTSGFFGSLVASSGGRKCGRTAPRRDVTTMLVSEVSSRVELDKVLESAGESLVVVDYSTSWCGPCKFIYPAYEKLSDVYSDVVFLKVMGDKDDKTSEMMKTEAIRSVPAFHFWKSKEKVHSITGANITAIEDSVKMYK